MAKEEKEVFLVSGYRRSSGPLLLLTGPISWIRSCRPVWRVRFFCLFFFRAAGFLHRVKTINCIPQNLCHSHLCHVLNGAPLQVIRFLSSLRRCGSSVYAEKTKVSAAGNINTHWICHGGHFPGRIKKKS